MDLVEVNADISSDGTKRPKYREEEYYNDVSQSIGIGIDLIESAFRKYLILWSFIYVKTINISTKSHLNTFRPFWYLLS